MPIEIDSKEAARRLGVSRQRVIQLLNEPCAECQGQGCERCHHTGRRLPARRTCCGSKAKMMIKTEDLILVSDRPVGRPRKVTTS
jgi:hypothetical protein